MTRRINYIPGQVIGEMEFVSDKPNINRRRMALFKCRCGKIVHTRIESVVKNHTKSCGCIKGAATTHGDTGNNLYVLWHAIKSRCLNPNHGSYNNYGGRGITIFKEWVNNYPLFKDWIITNIGERPDNLTLDRINNDLGYEPGNLRWLSREGQARNRRDSPLTVKQIKSIKTMLKDGSMEQQEIADTFKVDKSTISSININRYHKEITI